MHLKLHTFVAGKNEVEISILQFIFLNESKIIGTIQTGLKQCKSKANGIAARVFEALQQRFSDDQMYQTKELWEATDQLVRKEVKMHNQLVFNNFNLSSEEFEQMLSALQNGDEALFEQVFLSHFKACCRFLQDRFNASPTDAYDVSMEALLKFHKRLKAGKIRYGNLRYLFTQMASQIYMKWKRGPQIQTVPDNFDLIDESSNASKQENMIIFGKAWQKLCQDCKGLLQAFYYEKTPLVDIAKKTGKTDVALRKQKQRCLQKLRKHFQQIAN
ncbi:MAG: sigma-70 family RNA polymerase sigma factor [Saprospiraceae bacterium]|nr:sigma-70 family RNA polymerase sigma factor [Saprospiraceae bacterium]